jgi:threonine dehydratase
MVGFFIVTVFSEQGIEPEKCCCFFKAMENERPCKTISAARSFADTLAVPTVGFNAFHTAKSLIDKMVSAGFIYPLQNCICV